MEEVRVHAGHKASIEVDKNGALIVDAQVI
jgi:hypothetical protein